MMKSTMARGDVLTESCERKRFLRSSANASSILTRHRSPITYHRSLKLGAVSSVVEHYLDTVGVTGSNPVSRTTFSPAVTVKEQSRSATFGELSTPLVADAALRRKIAFRIAPPGIKPVVLGARIAGDALPAEHFGSVDVFLEAMKHSKPGNALVIDNGGGMGQGCSSVATTLDRPVSRLAGVV